MTQEQFTNNAATTLSGNGGSITSGATSFSVASASGFPTSGAFRIIIESEIIIVGSVSGTTFSSCTRGAEGTTAASHNDGVSVTHVLTAGGLKNLITPIRTTMTNPDDSAYAWINQASATLTDYGDRIKIVSGTTDGVTLRKRTAPSTPYSVIIAVRADVGDVSLNQINFGFRQSSDGKLACYGLLGSGTLEMQKWNSPTSWNSNYSTLSNFTPYWYTQRFLTFWFKFTDNGTNRIFYSSPDGENWTQHHSIGRTDFLTADEVFFGCGPAGSSGKASTIHLLSWTIE